MELKQVLFIQGGGEGGYEADEALVVSLESLLGKEYVVNYPKILSDESKSDFGWTKQIGKKISESNDDFILAGHSFGASMILKFLSENPVTKKIKGIFLIATPFWSGNDAWKQDLKLKENFADNLPVGIPIILYHCKDDEEIPFSHFERYQQKLTQANFRKIESGGHQCNNHLTLVANDIKLLNKSTNRKKHFEKAPIKDFDENGVVTRGNWLEHNRITGRLAAMAGSFKAL